MLCVEIGSTGSFNPSIMHHQQRAALLVVHNHTSGDPMLISPFGLN